MPINHLHCKFTKNISNTQYHCAKYTLLINILQKKREGFPSRSHKYILMAHSEKQCKDTKNN